MNYELVSLPRSTFHKKIQLKNLPTQKLTNSKTKTMNKEKWKFVIQTVIAILTAIATSLGVASCIY